MSPKKKATSAEVGAAIKEHMGEKLNLFQRLNAVTAHVGKLKKDGTNSFHKYNYVTESNIMASIQPLCAQFGVHISCSFEIAQPPHPNPEISSVFGKFVVTNVDDPTDQLTVGCPGYGHDKGDKGIYKAITGAYKYFCMKMFMIASDDDPENEKTAPSRSTPKKRINLSKGRRLPPEPPGPPLSGPDDDLPF